MEVSKVPRRIMLLFILLIFAGCTSTVEKAEKAAAKGDFPQAIKLYQKALEDQKLKAPEVAEIHYSLGGLLDKLQQYTEAVEEYKLAIEMKPETLKYYLAMADDLERIGMLDQELIILQNGMILDPKNAHIQQMLGETQAKLGQFVNAKETFEKAYQLNQRDPQNLINLGLIYDKCGDSKKAVSYWEGALKLKPGHEMALMDIGAVKNRQGDYRGAIKIYAELTRLYPDKPRYHNFLGINYFNNQQFNEALKEFREVSKLDSSFPGVQDNIRLAKRGLTRAAAARRH